MAAREHERLIREAACIGKGGSNFRLRGFSDIEGMHLIRMTNAVDKRQDVAHRLKKIGCNVDMRGTDWHNAGDFIPRP